MTDGTDSRIEQVTFQANEVLFHEHEVTFHFFVIQEGEVEVYKTSIEGNRITLGVLGPGTSIGEFAMLDHKPRSASCRALTTVHAAKVSEEAYNELITELPEWAIAVMRGMIDRLRHTNEIIRRSGAAERVKSDVTKVMEASGFENAPDDEFGDSPFLSTSEED